MWKLQHFCFFFCPFLVRFARDVAIRDTLVACLLYAVVCVCAVSCVYACLYIVDCTKSDTCAEEEYRERDSSCEVKLRLPTAAAAAATTYRMWLYFCHLRSGTHNVCILIPKRYASQPSTS